MGKLAAWKRTMALLAAFFTGVFRRTWSLKTEDSGQNMAQHVQFTYCRFWLVFVT